MLVLMIQSALPAVSASVLSNRTRCTVVAAVAVGTAVAVPAASRPAPSAMSTSAGRRIRMFPPVAAGRIQQYSLTGVRRTTQVNEPNTALTIDPR
jgi:hypothetical protein